jgi:hypothetical protein
MRPVAKAGLVAIGFAAAFAIAVLVVRIYVAATSGPDRQTYGTMFAFGDSLLFLAVFGLAAVPATAAGLFFLRPRPTFWTALSIASLAVACTSLAVLLTYAAPTAFASLSPLHSWFGLAPLRILAAPLFAIFFLLSGLLAPNSSARISLIAAATIEIAVFAYVAFIWSHPLNR